MDRVSKTGREGWSGERKTDRVKGGGDCKSACTHMRSLWQPIGADLWT
jgi:hypothetical protein